jgi:hypothetical protein
LSPSFGVRQRLEGYADPAARFLWVFEGVNGVHQRDEPHRGPAGLPGRGFGHYCGPQDAQRGRRLGSGRFPIQRSRRKARSLSSGLPNKAVPITVSATASSWCRRRRALCGGRQGRTGRAGRAWAPRGVSPERTAARGLVQAGPRAAGTGEALVEIDPVVRDAEHGQGLALGEILQDGGAPGVADEFAHPGSVPFSLRSPDY